MLSLLNRLFSSIGSVGLTYHSTMESANRVLPSLEATNLQLSSHSSQDKLSNIPDNTAVKLISLHSSVSYVNNHETAQSTPSLSPISAQNSPSELVKTSMVTKKTRTASVEDVDVTVSQKLLSTFEAPRKYVLNSVDVKKTQGASVASFHSTSTRKLLSTSTVTFKHSKTSGIEKETPLTSVKGTNHPITQSLTTTTSSSVVVQNRSSRLLSYLMESSTDSKISSDKYIFSSTKISTQNVPSSRESASMASDHMATSHTAHEETLATTMSIIQSSTSRILIDQMISSKSGQMSRNFSSMSHSSPSIISSQYSNEERLATTVSITQSSTSRIHIDQISSKSGQMSGNFSSVSHSSSSIISSQYSNQTTAHSSGTFVEIGKHGPTTLTTTKSIPMLTGEGESRTTSFTVMKKVATIAASVSLSRNPSELNASNDNLSVFLKTMSENIRLKSSISPSNFISSSKMNANPLPTQTVINFLPTTVLHASVLVNLTHINSTGQASQSSHGNATSSLLSKLTSKITASKVSTEPVPSNSIWVEPYYHEWANWSNCSLTCGGGYKYRTRNCFQDGECGELGPNINVSTCNMDKCNGNLNFYFQLILHSL